MIIQIVLITLLTLFIISEIIFDFIEIRRTRKIQNKSLLVEKNKLEKSFGIVVELGKSYQSMIFFLDHINSFDYKKSKVLIIANKNTNQNTVHKIYEYINKNKSKNIKIIYRKRTNNIVSIIRNNLFSKYVIFLRESDRLSKNFFNKFSIGLLDDNNTGFIYPLHQIYLSNNLTCLFQSHFNILSQLYHRIFGIITTLLPLRTGIIYDRKSIVDNLYNHNIVKVYLNYHIYISRKSKFDNFYDYINYEIDKSILFLRSKIGIIVLILSIVVMISLVAIVKYEDLLIIIIAIFSLYTLCSLFIQMRTKGYSIIDNINLFLITPIGLIFKILIYIFGLIKLILLSLYSNSDIRLSDKDVN